MRPLLQAETVSQQLSAEATAKNDQQYCQVRVLQRRFSAQHCHKPIAKKVSMLLSHFKELFFPRLTPTFTTFSHCIPPFFLKGVQNGSDALDLQCGQLLNAVITHPCREVVPTQTSLRDASLQLRCPERSFVTGVTTAFDRRLGVWTIRSVQCCGILLRKTKQQES